MKHTTATPETLYDDEYLVVVHKPAGLLSIPDRFAAHLPNLRAILQKKYGEIFVVHRIDRDTSGVMVFAKNADTHKLLNDQFEHRQVQKVYHAVVQGSVEKEEMTIDIPLRPDPQRPGCMMPSVRGKEALTTVRIVRRFRMATLLECELITGRQHQIRVHCAAIGHPLLVDADYGTASEFRVSSIKRRYNLGKWEEEKPLISRTTLHAYRLKFIHPITQIPVECEAPYPKDFKALLQILDKYVPYRSALGVWDSAME